MTIYLTGRKFNRIEFIESFQRQLREENEFDFSDSLSRPDYVTIGLKEGKKYEWSIIEKHISLLYEARHLFVNACDKKNYIMFSVHSRIEGNCQMTMNKTFLHQLNEMNIGLAISCYAP